MDPRTLAALRLHYEDGGSAPFPTLPDGNPGPSGKAMDVPTTPQRGMANEDVFNPGSHFTDGMRQSDMVEDRRPSVGQRPYTPSYAAYLYDYYDALHRMQEEDAKRMAEKDLEAHAGDYGEPDLPRSRAPQRPPMPRPRPKLGWGGDAGGDEGDDGWGGGYEGSAQQGLDAYGGGIGFDANQSFNEWSGGEGRNFDSSGNYTGGYDGGTPATSSSPTGGGGSSPAASAADEGEPATTGSVVGQAAAADEAPDQETRAPPADLSREIAGIMGTSRGKPGEDGMARDEAEGQQGFAAPRDPGAGPSLRSGAKPGEDRAADDMATGLPGGQQLTGMSSEFGRMEDAYDRAAINAGVNPLEVHKALQIEAQGMDTSTAFGGAGGHYVGMSQADDQGAWNNSYAPVKGTAPGAYSIDNQAAGMANEYAKFQALHPQATGFDAYMAHQQGFGGYNSMVNNPDKPLTPGMESNTGPLPSDPTTRGQFYDAWAKEYGPTDTNTAVAYNDIVGAPASSTAVAAVTPGGPSPAALGYSQPPERDNPYGLAPRDPSYNPDDAADATEADLPRGAPAIGNPNPKYTSVGFTDPSSGKYLTDEKGHVLGYDASQVPQGGTPIEGLFYNDAGWNDPATTHAKVANAASQPIAGVIEHHTGPGFPTVDSAIDYGYTEHKNPFTGQGATTGYGYYVGSDGKVVQARPETERTNHIESGRNRTDAADLSNRNTVGVSMVAPDSEHATPEQEAAARNITAALADRYGVGSNVYGHGEIQGGNRMATEGQAVAQAVRDGYGYAGNSVGSGMVARNGNTEDGGQAVAAVSGLPDPSSYTAPPPRDYGWSVPPTSYPTIASDGAPASPYPTIASDGAPGPVASTADYGFHRQAPQGPASYPTVASDGAPATVATIMRDYGFHQQPAETAWSRPLVSAPPASQAAVATRPAPAPERPASRFNPTTMAAAYTAANRDPASLALGLATRASSNVAVDEGTKHDAYLDWLLRNGYAPRSS